MVGEEIKYHKFQRYMYEFASILKTSPDNLGISIDIGYAESPVIRLMYATEQPTLFSTNKEHYIELASAESLSELREEVLKELEDIRKRVREYE